MPLEVVSKAMRHTNTATTEGYLRQHDRLQFELHAFMTLEEDPVSDFLRPLVDYWHSVQALDDDALQAIVDSTIASIAGGEGMKAMGKVIAAVRAAAGPTADGAKIAALVKVALAG